MLAANPEEEDGVSSGCISEEGSEYDLEDGFINDATESESEYSEGSAGESD